MPPKRFRAAALHQNACLLAELGDGLHRGPNISLLQPAMRWSHLKKAASDTLDRCQGSHALGVLELPCSVVCCYVHIFDYNRGHVSSSGMKHI